MISVVMARLASAWHCFLVDLPRPPLGWLLPLVLALCVFMGVLVDRAVIRAAAEMDETYRRFFEIVTKFGDAVGWLVLLIVGIGVSVLIARRAIDEETRARFLAHAQNLWFVVLTVLVSGVLHHILKILIGRYRPRYLFSEDLYGLSPLNFEIAQNSFPSGHTQTIVAVCFALFLVYPRLAALWLLIAGLVGISRVTVLAHYPSDVLGGAYLAICTAILLKRHYLDPRATRVLKPVESGR
jgi:membrane-associated phospholipid phosphatase